MKIAFCKYGGLATGGTEKYLQSLALLYNEAGHQIDYYYTDATPIEGTDWKHPDTCPERRKLLKSAGINTRFVQVQRRGHAAGGSEWIGTNFFDLFNEEDYDFLVTAGDGRAEFPYTHLKQIPIIHTIHGWHAYNAPNIHKSVLLCKWQADRWLASGGDTTKLQIIPPLIPIPTFTSIRQFRRTHNIPSSAVVLGLHQAPGEAPGVASLVSLEAFASIESDDLYYVILGGDEQHRSFCQSRNIQNVIFIPLEPDTQKVHSFLSEIDIYAHCRHDGEVCSASLIEAMAHGKPIISHVGNGTNLGHLEQIEGIGKVTNNPKEYADEIRLLLDSGYRAEVSKRSKQKYLSKYATDVVENQILGLL